MNIQAIYAEAATLLSKLEAMNSSGAMTTEIAAVAGIAGAINPAAGAAVEVIGGLLSVGERLYEQFKAIGAQTAATAPAVWDEIVKSNVLADANVMASGEPGA